MSDESGEAVRRAVNGDAIAAASGVRGDAEAVFEKLLPAVGGDLASVDGVGDSLEFESGENGRFDVVVGAGADALDGLTSFRGHVDRNDESSLLSTVVPSPGCGVEHPKVGEQSVAEVGDECDGFAALVCGRESRVDGADEVAGCGPVVVEQFVGDVAAVAADDDALDHWPQGGEEDGAGVGVAVLVKVEERGDDGVLSGGSSFAHGDDLGG